MFAIGLATQPRVLKKRKLYTVPTMYQSPKYNSKLLFKTYTGSRWQIPSGIKVSQSVHMKFALFETRSIQAIFSDINLRIKNPPQIFNHGFTMTDWKPPREVLSIIQSFKDRQINEFKKVKSIYRAIFRMIYYLKKLVHIRRIYQSLRNIKNTLDIVTLELPLKPVYVIDSKRAISNVYEASSIRRAIEGKLLFSDYMFPEVKEPINIFTNEPFTYVQLISIVNQCIKHGEFSWVIDRFKRCNYNIHTFEKMFQQQLKLEAINTFFKSRLTDVQDMVTDYIITVGDSNNISENKIESITNMIINHPTYTYVKRWIQLTKRFYIARELRNIIDLNTIKNEASVYIKSQVV